MRKNKGEKTKNSKLGIYLLIITLIAMGVLGYILGSKNNSEVLIANAEEYKIDVKERITYKTKDGKKELIILPENDPETKGKDNQGKYFAYYNGKLVSLETPYKLGKYIEISGDDYGENLQCKKYGFVINEETKQLMSISDRSFVMQINDKYYIMDLDCNVGTIGVYKENGKKIGTRFLGNDNKYYYILDENIVRYDINGIAVDRSPYIFQPNEEETKYEDLYFYSYNYHDVLYLVINNKKNIYFIDTTDYRTIEIGTKDEYAFGVDAPYSGMKVFNGRLVVFFRNKNDEEVVLKYNMTERNLELEE